MDNIATWMVAWLEQRGKLDGSSLEEKLQVNYFDAGIIDSLGVIEMIADIEKYYGIYFNENHFQDRRFIIVGGLIEIITGLLHSDMEKKHA